MLLSKQFGTTNQKVIELQRNLNQIKLLGLAGAALGGAGFMGLAIIGKMLRPAEEYVHQLNVMNMAGMKQKEIAEAVADAWKLAGENLTTTATGNLKAILDLRNVTGSLEHATALLPMMQRMQTILAASSESRVRGSAGDLSFTAMKALDIRGAVTDPTTLTRQADLMTRVILGTQGRVTPQQFQQVFWYARQGKFALSDDFAYKILPTLMLEAATKQGGGGGSRGVGPMIGALYRFTNQGYVNKLSIPELQKLGLMTGAPMWTSTRGTMVAPLKQSDLAGRDPFTWVNEVVVPAIRRKYGQNVSDDFIGKEINLLTRGNQLAGSVLNEFFRKRKVFERDRRLFEGVLDPAEAYKAAMSKDPATARAALASQWENFKTSLTMNVAPLLVPALMALSKGLNQLGAWAREYPGLTKSIVLLAAGLSGLAVAGGTILLFAAAFKGIGLALALFGPAGAGMVLKGLATGMTAFALALGVLAAALAGYAVGTAAHSGLNVLASKLAGRDETIGGLLADMTRPDPMGVAPARHSQGLHAPGNVYLDGHLVGKHVARELGREASRPPAGTTGFDPNMNLTPVGASGRW